MTSSPLLLTTPPRFFWRAGRTAVPVGNLFVHIHFRVLAGVVQEQERFQRHAVALQALRAGELGEESPEVGELGGRKLASLVCPKARNNLRCPGKPVPSPLA